MSAASVTFFTQPMLFLFNYTSTKSLVTLYLDTRYDDYECNNLRDKTICSFLCDLGVPGRCSTFDLLAAASSDGQQTLVIT